MATRRQSIPVPIFSAYEISLAQECAISLWQGVDFESGLTKELSDEELLHSFSMAFRQAVAHPNLPNSISEYQVRQLARLAKIKAFYRSTLPTDFQAGIASINSLVVPNFHSWANRAPGMTRKSLVLQSVIDMAASFVPNKKFSLNGNYRVPLAARLLFYSVPDFPIFAFSSKLSESMNFQVRPQVAYAFFFDAMYRGLWDNKRRLGMISLPPSTLFSSQQLDAIKKSGWWKRRVLDLALLNHFGLSRPLPHITQLAAMNASRYL